MDLRFVLAGLIVGTLVGISGVGGSAILAPILILFLGVKPIVAVGTDLIYSVPTKLLNAVMHSRAGNIAWGMVGILLVGGVPGALVGLAVVVYLRSHMDIHALNQTIRHGIGIAILLACLGALLNMVWRHTHAPPTARPRGPATTVERVSLIASGAFVGFLVAVTSVGSGSVTLPLLMFILPAFSLRRIIGTEIGFSAFLVPLAAAGHISLGDVDWRATLSLLVGSLPGVVIGSRLVIRISDAWLRPIVIAILAFAGYKLI
jgi:hypothetical protein